MTRRLTSVPFRPPGMVEAAGGIDLDAAAEGDTDEPLTDVGHHPFAPPGGGLLPRVGLLGLDLAHVAEVHPSDILVEAMLDLAPVTLGGEDIGDAAEDQLGGLLAP